MSICYGFSWFYDLDLKLSNWQTYWSFYYELMVQRDVFKSLTSRSQSKVYSLSLINRPAREGPKISYFKRKIKEIDGFEFMWKSCVREIGFR